MVNVSLLNRSIDLYKNLKRIKPLIKTQYLSALLF